MIKSGKSQSMKDRQKATIDESRGEIDRLEAEINNIQGVFDSMAREIKAKVQLRIKQVSDGEEIFADLEAANLATEQNNKALEARLDAV